MKLLLSGGGDPDDVVAIDRFFVSQIDLQKPVLYIPIAWVGDPTYNSCFNWFKETFQPYGITNIEMCTDFNHVSDLERYAAVFIGGGNTFKLLKEIKDSHFNEKLLEYFNKGGFVYGGSAGAIIFGKTIKSCEYADDNDVGLTDLSGFNLVGNRDIICHYSVNDNEFISAYDNDLYILYEESGIFVSNNAIQSIGKPFLNKNDIAL